MVYRMSCVCDHSHTSFIDILLGLSDVFSKSFSSKEYGDDVEAIYIGFGIQTSLENGKTRKNRLALKNRAFGCDIYLSAFEVENVNEIIIRDIIYRELSLFLEKIKKRKFVDWDIDAFESDFRELLSSI